MCSYTSSTSSLVTASSVKALSRWACRAATASNQPTRRGRPVVAPYSFARSRRFDERERVNDPVAERCGGREHAVGDSARVERRVAESLEDGVLGLKLTRHPLAEPTFVLHLVDLDPVPPDLVGIGRPDAHPCGAELLAAALPLVEAIERD